MRFSDIEDPTVYRPVSLAWGTRRHFEGMRKELTSIKTIHRNLLNLEPALILASRKIRPRIEVLACQKQAQHLINESEPY
jgi:hypothetical protein